MVVEEAHALYQRDGDDLVHNAKIPLVRALSGCTLELATLDAKDGNKFVSLSRLPTRQGLLPRSHQA